MTENEPQVKGDWREATNRVIADNLVKSIEQLLGGTAKYYTCSDKKNIHKRIVIEYDHGSNLQ